MSTLEKENNIPNLNLSENDKNFLITTSAYLKNLTSFMSDLERNERNFTFRMKFDSLSLKIEHIIASIIIDEIGE